MVMVKRIIITLIGIIVLIGGLAGIKYLQIERMTASGNNFMPPPEIVTTAIARNDSWKSLLAAIGSRRDGYRGTYGKSGAYRL